MIVRALLSGIILVGLTPDVIAAVAPSAPHTDSDNVMAAEAGTLFLRGLDKITGHPTDIIAPIGKPVVFATLRIITRYCYSTPPSETPETVAFVQIDDLRPDQSPKHVFSGWMYASSPGLNGLDHPLYDVWVITCKQTTPGEVPATIASTAPVKVRSPDSTDNEGLAPLPGDAGR